MFELVRFHTCLRLTVSKFLNMKNFVFVQEVLDAPELNGIYDGRVNNITSFGAFIQV